MSEGLKKIFGEASRTYDRVNNVLTFGLDRRWRKRAAEEAAVGGGARWIDVCTGTGEMALSLLKMAPQGTSIHASDFCSQMLDRAREKTRDGQLSFVEADTRDLPYPDCYFDLVTLSFATRNINTTKQHMLQCLREIYRVLKTGGRFVNLETSQPELKLIRSLYHLYVRTFVRPIGTALSGSKTAYRYLSSTIPVFYNAGEFTNILYRAGFTEVATKPLLFGTVAIHRAIK
jgi:demethylmenaquinone methyltransferase/2-methoxy-6-polyprenyl-1,4-benzoquinol methylase